MTRVTDHFGISGAVPFVDVHIEKDNALYLDPSAIRNGRDARSRRANSILVDFFSRVISLRLSSSASDHRQGLALLQHLHEPNQTRLGVSATGVGGKAFGPGLADEVWDELGRNPAARADALTRLEHLPVFLDRVGPDLISDLATRIVFEVLVDFTHDMMRDFPALATTTTTEDIFLYDASIGDWRDIPVELPFFAPHQLLLIPKDWVYWRLLMWAEPFYNRFATSTVRLERGRWGRDGKFTGPSKKQLKVEFRDHRRLNNLQTVKYMEQNRNLVAEYQEFVDRNYEPMTDDEISRRIED